MTRSVTIYVSDTHSLVWYLGQLPELSQPALEVYEGVFTQANRIVVPTIVIAEMVMMVEKRRLALDVAQVVARLAATPGYEFVPITPALALQIAKLSILPDIHDRLIVATALEQNATVITRDRAITESKLVRVVW